MKRIGLGLALAACAQAALAARPVVIGTNGSGPLSLAANVGWVRTGAYWSTVEPAPGQWDWNVADAIVDGARANGQQVLYILSGAPQWACGCTNGAARPANIELWKDFVSHVALHMKGRVAAYEIWNEPDLTANTTYGVGWDADLNASPRYVDYLVEAAQYCASKSSPDPMARFAWSDPLSREEPTHAPPRYSSSSRTRPTPTATRRRSSTSFPSTPTRTTTGPRPTRPTASGGTSSIRCRRTTPATAASRSGSPNSGGAPR